jgi:hypothetical protein
MGIHHTKYKMYKKATFYYEMVGQFFQHIELFEFMVIVISVWISGAHSHQSPILINPITLVLSVSAQSDKKFPNS